MNEDKIIDELESFDSFFAGLPMQDEKNAMALYEQYVLGFIALSKSQARQSALEEAKGVLAPEDVRIDPIPPGKWYAQGFNACRTQTLAAIEGLIKKTV